MVRAMPNQVTSRVAPTTGRATVEGADLSTGLLSICAEVGGDDFGETV